LRNALNHACEVAVCDVAGFLGSARQIRLRHDTDAVAIVVDDDHAPNLLIRHHPFDRLQLIVRQTALGIRSHQFPDSGIGAFSLSNTAYSDVSIGDNAHNAAIIARIDDWNTSAIVLCHELRDSADRFVRCNARWTHGHEILCSHMVSPSSEATAPEGLVAT
jgi:hypothetical protein